MRRITEERGQGLVELALILPMMLLLIFGVLEFARGFNYSDQVSQVANETARWVIVDQLPAYTDQAVDPPVAVAAKQGPTITDYKHFAYSRLVSKNLQTSTGLAGIHIMAPSANPTARTDPVTVWICTAFTPEAAKLIGFDQIKLKGSASMLLELPPTNAAGQFEIDTGSSPC